MGKLSLTDLVRLTAIELQTFMNNGELTSVELVKQCLTQIHRHNRQGLDLRAVISVAPDELILDAAAALDAERRSGKLRSPLHGIPVLVKDAIRTSSALGMPTCVGNVGLLESMSTRNAAVVDQMIESGLLIIGKSNLNEFISWKALGSVNGWSAAGGQTNSAYIDGRYKVGDGIMAHSNPCGSSTGSAVGVSSGFSPIGIGTEFDGSLCQPAARAALYGLKPTIGSVDADGIFSVHESFDTVGVMAKCTDDLARITEIIFNAKARASLPPGGFRTFTRDTFENLRIGCVDPTDWNWPEFIQPQYGGSLEQMRNGYSEAIDRIRKHKGEVVGPLTIPPVSAHRIDGQMASTMAIRYVYKDNVEKFLGSYSESKLRTVEDVIQYNKDHADIELPPDFPEQGKLVSAIETPVGKDKHDAAMDIIHEATRNGIDRVLADQRLDLIAFPMDSPCSSIAASGGYPIATVPLGTLDCNGRPFGLALIASAGKENLIFSFMSAFENVSKPRALPASLMD